MVWGGALKAVINWEMVWGGALKVHDKNDAMTRRDDKHDNKF